MACCSTRSHLKSAIALQWCLLQLVRSPDTLSSRTHHASAAVRDKDALLMFAAKLHFEELTDFVLMPWY